MLLRPAAVLHALRSIAVALTLLSWDSSASAARLAVPLVVEEPAGTIRRAFPATASVPLPQGLVPGPEALWLARPDGRPALVQLRALERWPDGSVRWLLADFLADVPAGGRATYTLRDGPGRAAAAGPLVRIDRHERRWTLDTGPLRVVVEPDSPTLLAAIGVAGTTVAPIALPGVTLAGADQTPLLPEGVTLETEGPVRTELLLRGRSSHGIAHEIRLAVFAGQPFVRVQHTVTNRGDPSFAMVRGVSVSVAGRFAAEASGIDQRAHPLAPDRPHVLRQVDEATLTLDGRPAGRRGDGWLRAGAGGLAVTLVSRYFTEEFPQALAADAEGLRLDVLAGDSLPIALGSGAAKTHEWWLAAAPAASAGRPEDLVAALRAPLVTLPAADWIVSTRALPQALAPAAPGGHDFLPRLTAATMRYLAAARTERWDDGPPVPCDQRTSERPRTGFFGALNWGDWNFPRYRDSSEDGCDTWGNLEYDLPSVFALAYAATGNRIFMDALVPAARHYRDVDIVHHWAEHPEYVGMNHPHKPLHFALESIHRVDLGHTWLEGLLLHWRLTGEARSLEAARGIADVLTRFVHKAGNPRQLGWPMIALTAAADATGERRYLDAARTYADHALRRVPPTPAAGDWKMGILADGLAAVHAATRAAPYRAWLDAYAAALLPAAGRWPDPRYALPMGYLASLTRDPSQVAFALDVARRLRIADWGKPLAIAGRTGFRLLAPLQQP